MKKVYLDVRSSEEFNELHVLNAINFDLSRLLKGEMPDISKDTEILVYCVSGARAGVAVQILKENGFVNAKNVGGISSLI